MSDAPKPAAGTIGWLDLTVDNAKEIRDFYQAVTGWTVGAVSMGDYDDYNMQVPSTSTPVAGVCHKRGGNADLPSAWMVYVNVADLDESMQRCHDLGGKVISGPKGMGNMGRYCIIEDPAGAVMALFEPKDE